jgi:hypothetical protein
VRRQFEQWIAVIGIMSPRQPGIPKRKKSDIHIRLSCKIDYLLRSNHNDQSIASEFFTGDGRLARCGNHHAAIAFGRDEPCFRNRGHDAAAGGIRRGQRQQPPDRGV